MANLQKQIDAAKVELEAYQKYQESNYDELAAEVTRLQVEQGMAWSELAKANAARYEALSAKDDLLKPYGKYNASSNIPTNVDKESHRMLIAMDSLSKLSNNPGAVFGNYGTINGVSFMNHTTVTLNDERFKTNTDNTYDLVSIAIEYSNSITVGVYAIAPESILQTSLDIKEAIGVPSVESLTNPVVATNLYAEVEDAEDALKDAQDALVAAQKGDDEQVIVTAQTALIQRQRELAAAEEALGNALEAQAAFERLADEVALDGEAYKAYVEEINALGENEVLVAYFDACVAHDEANDNYVEVSAQLKVAEYLKNNGEDVAQKIIDLEEDIADNEKAIADLAGNVTIQWYTDNEGVVIGFYIVGNGQDYYTIVLEQVNNYITRLTEEIALQEEIVALAKAALDAALAE